MASSTENNPAASDPAALYWDWERTKILNRPSGLGPPGKMIKYPPGFMPPEQPPWDKPQFQRPGQPRAGTLKRTNAFSGGEKPQTVASHDLKTASIETAPDGDNSPEPPKANVDFPETLYSIAKRRFIEDKGNKFIESIQKLDKGKPGELVDFNPILENHWNELAKFYSEQVSIVRMLEKRTESILLSVERGLPTNPSPKLPAHMISRLEEYKGCLIEIVLFALAYAKCVAAANQSKPMLISEQAPYSPLVKPKGAGFASSLIPEANHPVPADPAFGSSKYERIEEKDFITPGGFREMNSIKEAHCTTEEEPKLASLDKIDKATPSTPTMDAYSKGKAAETVRSINVKVKEPAEAILHENPMEVIHEDLETVTAILKEAVRAELDVPTNSRELAKNSDLPKLEMTIKDTIKHKDIINTTGGIGQNKDEVTQSPNTNVTGNADPCEIAGTVNAQPMANFSVEAGLKAFWTKQFKGMGDASINSSNKTDIQTDHNTSRVGSKSAENKAVESEKANVDSNDVAKDDEGRKIVMLMDPESDLEATIETNPGKPHPFMDDQMDNDEKDIYRSDSNEASNKISNLDIDNEGLDLLDSSDISSEAGFSVDIVFDTTHCNPEEVTFEEAGVTSSLTSHTVAATENKTEESMTEKEDPPQTFVIAEPLPPDSNDSSSVFGDSSLSFGSTKCELERLQMEVTDYLEKVERIEGSFVAEWIDEFGVKREKKVVEPGEMMTESPSEDEEEGSGDDQGDNTTEFEYYTIEVEYYHERDENQEDDEIDEMEGILARLHEVEKEEAEAGGVDKTGIGDSKDGITDNSSIQSRSSTNSGEDGDGDDDDQVGETKSEEEYLNVAKQLVSGKELSVVEEEEEEEDGEEEGAEEGGREEIKEDLSDDSGDCENCENCEDGNNDSGGCEDCEDGNNDSEDCEDCEEDNNDSEGCDEDNNDSEGCDDCDDNNDSNDCEGCKYDNEGAGEEGSESEGPITSIEGVGEDKKIDDKKEEVYTKVVIASFGEELKLEGETEEAPKDNAKETNIGAEMNTHVCLNFCVIEKTG